MDSKFSSKQALLFSIINYIGVAIGMISTLFIYPNDKEFLGIVRFIDGFAQILYPIMVLGASTALLNFQPQLNAFLQRKLFSYSAVSIIFMIGFCAFFVSIFYFLEVTKNTEYYIYGFIIAVFLAFIDLMKRQAYNLQKIAVPTFFEKIVPKITLPLAFILVLYFSVSYHQALSIYTFSFLLIFIAIGWYLLRIFKPVYSFNYQDLFQEISKKDYYKYSLYAFCASLGSFFAFRIDSIMIPEFISNEANGDFNIGVNLANALMIPAIGVFALYSPIISEALKNNDFKLLKNKYTEVAKNLYFIGILMFGCLLLGISDLFSLLPTAQKLAPTIPILYILGVNVILNMSTGFSTEIIAYSKFYKFNLIAILSLAVLNIGLNYLILTQTDFGIIGVAYASLISMFVFNLMKLIFIYKKFQILPINISYLKTILLSLVLLFLCWILPIQFLGDFSFVIRCALFSISFSGIVFLFGWVPELNTNVFKILNKLKS
ncbi:hypothetical protein EG240_14795 [Paenimyroides tangerinum]|uniref:Uncharacterized protein n=1 Tax=Paenimyroides tangerinum TaxID=2488728 RepID=A0A3P3W231_9FLAO|nr:polysaccharide biosynthesis C-terminal domain-containing protein [Paenimyroides tangerinum]RRJ87689.1 hypothetical protein EG240_14795 [Paenimyroides tangerinum]